MTKKAIPFLTLAALALVLGACAAATPVATPTPAAATGAGAPESNLENRLAVGTLELEGTSLAVTADQAKQLLPLWSTIKDMMSNASTTNSDLLGEYQRVESAMTADQLQAIQKMTIDQTQIQSLMQKYNIQVTPFAGTPFPGEGGGAFPTQSPDARATRTARETQNAGTPEAGFSGTPGARGFGGRGFNRIFLDPLIQLLTQRAGA